jgi:hypothetical protein
MGSKFATTARLAATQHGRVSWRQLVAAGVDRHLIHRWIEDDLLHPVHRGVYAVGHNAPSLQGDYMAAVLAGGAGAVLSHRAAAYLLKLLRGAPPAPEITVPTTAHRRRPGVIVHRVRSLPWHDTFVLAGIPITAVPRVLLDLTGSLGPEELTRACHEAWVQHRTRPAHVEACIARNPTKKGAAKLRRALGSDVTLSDLEDAFVKLVKTHELPVPRTNIDVRGDKVDCHWPALGLTVELITYRFHATRDGFEKDVIRRRRQNHIAYSYGDVVDRGAQTVAELRQLLASPSNPSTSARSPRSKLSRSRAPAQ